MTNSKTTRNAGLTSHASSGSPKSAEASLAATGSLPPAPFTILGLGASAGGLEAYEQFFHAAPPAGGLAYVLVPHLDPGHASILTEILQRATSMPVVEVQDQMVVMPDHVYIIPPNRDLAIFHGTLQLSVPELRRGQRMPIDAFLRSLADDQGERAVGIILSGTGTDGTLGLRAILGAGGVTLVQEPATAKYDGMPANAVQAGYATHVLPVDQMPAVLLAGARKLGAIGAGTSPVARAPASAPSAAASGHKGGINQVLMLLRSATGHDFSLYKQPYRTLDNVIDGVVLTFSDISRRIAAERTATRLLAESVADTVREPILIMDGEMRVVAASHAFYQGFQVTAEDTLGRRIFELDNRQWDILALRELLGTILPREQAFDAFPVEREFPGIGRRKVLLGGRRVVAEAGGSPLILLTIREDGPA